MRAILSLPLVGVIVLYVVAMTIALLFSVDSHHTLVPLAALESPQDAEAISSLAHCLSKGAMEYTAWEDWRACQTARLRAMHSTSNDSAHLFDDFLVSHASYSPWMQHSEHTAILLEFRAWERALNFSVHNIMNNLPVHWRIQVVGGPKVCAMAQALFPVEIRSGKVILTDLGFDGMTQVRESPYKGSCGCAKRYNEGKCPYRTWYTTFRRE